VRPKRSRLRIGDCEKAAAADLGITRIIEQESLDISVWGSADNADWGTKPLLSYPQKFYCGTYQVLLDLNDRPEVRYLRVQWKVGRWGRGASKPLFGFYVFAEEMGRQPLQQDA
jgi:hypothetical protein